MIGLRRASKCLPSFRNGLRRPSGCVPSFRNGLRRASKYLPSFRNGLRRPSECVPSLRNGLRQPSGYVPSLWNGLRRASKCLPSLWNGLRRPTRCWLRVKAGEEAAWVAFLGLGMVFLLEPIAPNRSRPPDSGPKGGSLEGLPRPGPTLGGVFLGANEASSAFYQDDARGGLLVVEGIGGDRRMNQPGLRRLRHLLSGRGQWSWERGVRPRGGRA